MPKAHRNGDLRNCNATTIVEGQGTVYVNGKLWAVNYDPNSHGDGHLRPITGHTVFCEGKEIIVLTDTCYDPDDADHPPPSDDPAQASDDVFAYEE